MKMISFKAKFLTLKNRLLLSLLAVGCCLAALSAGVLMIGAKSTVVETGYLSIAVITAAIFFTMVLTYGVFDHLVFKRIRKINAAIRGAGQTDQHAQIGYLGNDEVGKLAAKLDEMLAYEAQAENELREQAKIFQQQASIRTLALTKQSEALETLFKSVEQGIGVFDQNLHLTACNDQWHRHLHLPQSYAHPGTSLESVVRWNAKNGFLGVGDVEELTQKLMEKYEKREPQVFDRQYEDGTICEINASPTVAGGMVYIVSDVTELKRVESELKAANERLEQRVESRTKELRGEITQHKRTEEALLESQMRLTRAQKISHIGYWGWGLESGRSYFSEEYPRILGVDEEHIPETQKEFNKLIHPDDYHRVAEYLEHVSAVEPQSFELDYRIIRPDGEIRYIREIGELVFDDDGQPEGHTGTIQDVSALKEYEVALVSAKEDAEIANRTKSEFLANMSHELRTPLNAIIGFSDILKDETFGPLNSENYMEYVGDIRESGGHLLEVLNDILDMSKIEAGEIQLDEDVFHIGDEIARSLRFVNEKILRKRIDLTVTHEKPSMLLYADRRVFKQIFLNLFSNALKFTDDNGKIAVTVRYVEDRAIELCVEDSGIGIAEDDMSKIMQPFGQVQASHARNFEGTGLGLSLVKNFVELHQGTVEIESALNEGTRVRIIFPKERTIDAI